MPDNTPDIPTTSPKITFPVLLILVILIAIGGGIVLGRGFLFPPDESTAISLVQKLYPELENYPADQLPLTRITTHRQNRAWYLSFEVVGSGLPSMLKARCFRVDSGRQIEEVGQFDLSEAEVSLVESLDPVTCRPHYIAPSQITY